MKCRCRFKVEGEFKLTAYAPIGSESHIWEFEENEGFVQFITVTTTVADPAHWPRITPSPKPGITYQITAVPPHVSFAQYDLSMLQKLLIFFGVRSIDIEHPTIEWIPENDEEKKHLKISSFSSGFAEPDPAKTPPLPFDIAARAILALTKAHNIEIPLSFYRRGFLDVRDREYIRGIYSFYFVLESMYGSGKFKKNEVIAKLSQSEALTKAIRHVLADRDLFLPNEVQLRKEFQSKYQELSAVDYIRHVVNLRGFLHHHTIERKNIWHPDKQLRYKLDAIILQHVAYQVLFTFVMEYIYDAEVVERYQKNLQKFPLPQG